MRVATIAFFFAFVFSARAQDSTYISLAEVLEWASENHPIIQQAGLQDRFARAELLTAKGALDPKIQSSYSRKELKDKTYYDKFYSVLKVPVWFPIDPKIELYQYQGDQLNNENYISASSDYWQMTAGISIPVGKGLIIDERRMMIRQAKAFADIAESDKIKLTNKTLLSISKAYWDWYFAQEQYELLFQSMQIAEELFRRAKLDYGFGEAAVIDTVQAKITYQSRSVEFEKAKLELIQARLGMSIHLWGKGNIPLELSEKAKPMKENPLWVHPSDSGISQLLNWSVTNHPEIQKLTAKLKQLEYQEKWNKESFKPEINLNYSLIDAPINMDGLATPDWEDSYKLGMEFSFPLYLRKERGYLQKTRVYQESLSFEKLQIQQEIQATITNTYASIETNKILVDQYEQLARNYEILLNAEIFNVENGESDLFKLNIQQDKFIQAQLKYLTAQMKYEKLKIQLPYDVGLPFLSYKFLYE